MGLEFNCKCENAVIVSVMGVERCVECKKLAGGDAFRAFDSPLPTRATRRHKVLAR